MGAAGPRRTDGRLGLDARPDLRHGVRHAVFVGRHTVYGAASDAPVVVIDGVRMPGAEGTLYTMRPHEISRLEVQPGAAAGWEYGSSGASGVIKITLRRGIADGQIERLERRACVVPEFPIG